MADTLKLYDYIIKPWLNAIVYPSIKIKTIYLTQDYTKGEIDSAIKYLISENYVTLKAGLGVEDDYLQIGKNVLDIVARGGFEKIEKDKNAEAKKIRAEHLGLEKKEIDIIIARRQIENDSYGKKRVALKSIIYGVIGNIIYALICFVASKVSLKEMSTHKILLFILLIPVLIFVGFYLFFRFIAWAMEVDYDEVD